MSNNFDAIVLKSKNNFELIKNISIPKKINKKKVLVKIFYSGLCRSQVMEIEQKRGLDKYLPHMMGHEATGIVIKTGSAVKKIKLGDNVVLSWIDSFTLKPQGIIFKHKKLKINAGPITTFSTYAVVSENKCIKIPRNFPKDVGVVFGCAALTGMGMALNEAKLKKNHKVLLIGLGGIGFFVYAGLLSKNIKNITVLDKNKKRNNFAKKLKIQKIYNNIQKLKKQNIKYDYCFDATGSVSAIEQGFKLLKNKGELIFASHPANGEMIKIDPFELIKGKKIRGSWGGNANPSVDVKKFYQILKRLDLLRHLNSKIYLLKDLSKAIKDLKSGKVIRPILKCN